MANTLNIPERTLAQVSDATNSINVIGGTDGRLSAYEPLVVRITNHKDNDAAEVGTNTEKMAIFHSTRHGEPWMKQGNVLETVIHQATIIDVPAPDPQDPDVPTLQVAPANVSCLYPNYDYSTFG